MESLYQNCVSQFDIDLLDQGTPDIQNALALPNAAARKQNIRFLKIRWKQVSDLVKRGKETNRALEDAQKQLFDKNEECKDLCKERNTLFNQTTESSKEIEVLKAQNELFQEKYLDAMNSISATKIHSMQFKELTIEFEKLQEKFKKIDREKTKEKQAKEIAETRLKRMLSEFVPPNKRKGSRWLNKLYKIYGISKEGNNNNNDSSEDSCADDMFDDIPVPMSPSFDRGDSADDKISNKCVTNAETKPKNVGEELVPVKNATPDFDNLGSIDTGRGSSLAFSDKSFHSPDYYMHDSPLSTPNLCNKCHVAKSDAATSPIPEEMMYIIPKAKTDLCNNKPKQTDACTSPVKIYDLVTSDAREISSKVIEFEPIHCDSNMQLTRKEKSVIKDHKYDKAIESDKCISDDESSTDTLQLTETPCNVESETVLQESEIHTVCKKDISSCQNSLLVEDMAVHDNTILSNLENNDTSNESDEHDTNMHHTHTTKTESIEDNKKERLHDDLLNKNVKIDHSDTSRNDHWVKDAELPTLPAKILQNIRPSLELNLYGHSMEIEEQNSNNDKDVNDLFMDNSTSITTNEVTQTSELASPTDGVTILHIELEEECVDDHLTGENTKVNEELPLISYNLIDKSTDLEDRKSEKDKLEKCLQLNNSDNIAEDNTTNIEIQTIISKMTSLHPMISPIPKTPSKKTKSRKDKRVDKLSSNIVNKSDNHDVEPVATTGGIDEYLNEIRKKTREAVGLFNSLPGFIEKFIITNVCKDKKNQELLRCLIQMESNNSQSVPENSSENGSHEVQSELENDDETNDTQDDVAEDSCTNEIVQEAILSSAEPKKLNDTIIYENLECPEDDMLDQNWDSDDSNEDRDLPRTGVINLHRIAKKRLTKLQRFKLKMLPKNKIRPELKRRAKKLGFKPKPIRPTSIFKKKVTDADSSATLNDKSVYDKAVKVVAESKAKTLAQKEARIIIEDCAIMNLNNSSDNSPKNVESIKRDLFKEIDNSPKSRDPLIHKKDKNESDTVSKRILRSNSLEKSERLLDNSIDKVNRKRKISQCQTLDENTIVKKAGIPNKAGDAMATNRRRRGICSFKASINDDVEMIDNSDQEPKAKRRGIGSRKSLSNQANDKIIENIDEEVAPKKSKLDDTEFPSPRILRSSNVKRAGVNNNDHEVSKQTDLFENVSNKEVHQDENFNNRRLSTRLAIRNENTNQCEDVTIPNQVTNHEDTSFRNQRLSSRLSAQNEESNRELNKNNSQYVKTSNKNILCQMIEKYAVPNGYFPKKIPENVINEKCDKLESSLDSINEMSSTSCTEAMNKLVAEIRNWKTKHFLTAFTKYLKNPQRKIELFKKTISPPAPTMTKKEQIWIYVLDQLTKCNWCKDLIEKILAIIEYTLFTLNKTPEMEVIEAMSHFYALLCRYYMKQSRLRLFVVDAMYCLSYKSIPLVLQCLEVWMFILPLGHMGLAKTPLVSCLVYLLHFYKCGRDSSTAVQEMRTILNRKYYYDFSEWNETRILDMFRACIMDLRDSDLERKILRMALIILAKRNGPKWCQINIIKNMLQPIIDGDATPFEAKRFCLLVMGPLVKPYPNEMKSYIEVIAHYLTRKLEQNNSQKMEEAIVTSLLFMNKHNSRINDFLFKWFPNKISPEFELILRDYVRSKSVKAWKHIFTENVTV